MKTCGIDVDLGNLAWAPVNNFEAVELLDRFNGIPTLGVFKSDGTWHLFWRVLSLNVASLWLYVPLTTAEHDALLAGDEGLTGVLFDRPQDCYVTIGAAHKNRLIFEREFHLKANMSQQDTWQSALDHARASLELALEHGLPPQRRAKVIEARRVLASV